MPRTIRLAAVALALSLAGTGPSRAEADRAATVAALLESSGAERQLAPIANQLADQLLATPGDELLPGLKVLLAEAARREFAADKLLAEVRTSLLAQLDEQKAQHVLGWLRTDLGRRITAIEEEASKRNDRAELEAYASSLREEPPPPERLALVRRLGAATEITRFTTDVTLSMMRATALAFNAASKTPRPEGDVRDAVARQSEQLAGALDGYVVVSMLKSYQGATDADLTGYVAFLETDSGRWYTRVVEDALLAAYENATARMAASAAAAVQEPPPSRAL